MQMLRYQLEKVNKLIEKENAGFINSIWKLANVQLSEILPQTQLNKL